jgi:hypothetical protein
VAAEIGELLDYRRPRRAEAGTVLGRLRLDRGIKKPKRRLDSFEHRRFPIKSTLDQASCIALAL